MCVISLQFDNVVSTPAGKHAPKDVKILPLDLTSGETSLKETVERAVSFFPDAGIDYMIHNAAYERPVSYSLSGSGDIMT